MEHQAVLSHLLRPGASSQVLTALEPVLRATLQRARQAWPGLAVETKDFVRCLAERLRASEDPAQSLDALHAGDLYLVCACLQGDRAALQTWERSFLASVTGAVAGVDSSPPFVDDVVQQLREKLLIAKGDRPAGLASYAGRGPLKNWLKVAALRLAVSLKRGGKPAADDRAGALEELAFPGESADLQYFKARYRPMFEEALKSGLHKLSARDRAVLHMHYVEKLGTERIGEFHGVHSSSVSRWMAGAREQLIAGVREQIGSRLRLPDTEVDGMLKQLRSQVNLSLTRILKVPAK